MTQLWASVLVLVTLPCTPKVAAGQAQVPADMREAFIQSGEFRIRYWEVGSGDVLVLIHGSFGDADVWREFAPLEELAKGWRVAALDLRGHGQSTKSYDPADYGRRMAADVIALLDALQVERAHVLGYSYGGLVAGELLVTYPHRLASLILGGASRQRPNTPEDVRWSVSLAEALERDDAVEWLTNALASGDTASDAAQRALVERRIARADLAASAAVLRATRDLVVPDYTLEVTAVPILAIIGERDPSRDEVRDMASVARHMRVAVIPGADHAAAPRTRQFWELVMEWLRGGYAQTLRSER